MRLISRKANSSRPACCCSRSIRALRGGARAGRRAAREGQAQSRTRSTTRSACAASTSRSPRRSSNSTRPSRRPVARRRASRHQATIDIAQLNLKYTQIRALDGKTARYSCSRATSLRKIRRPLSSRSTRWPIKISLALPQSDLPRIQARVAEGRLRAHRPARRRRPADAAQVDFISNHVDDAQRMTSCARRSRTPTPRWCLARSSASRSSSAGRRRDGNTAKASTRVPRANTRTSSPPTTGPPASDQGAVRPSTSSASIEGDVHPGDSVIVDGQLRVVPGVGGYVDAPKRGQESAGLGHEASRAASSTTRHDDARDGGARDLRPRRLFHAARERAAERRLPDDLRVGKSTGRRPERWLRRSRHRSRTCSRPCPVSTR